VSHGGCCGAGKTEKRRVGEGTGEKEDAIRKKRKAGRVMGECRFKKKKKNKKGTRKENQVRWVFRMARETGNKKDAEHPKRKAVGLGLEPPTYKEWSPKRGANGKNAKEKKRTGNVKKG